MCNDDIKEEVKAMLKQESEMIREIAELMRN